MIICCYHSGKFSSLFLVIPMISLSSSFTTIFSSFSFLAFLSLFLSLFFSFSLLSFGFSSIFSIVLKSSIVYCLSMISNKHCTLISIVISFCNGCTSTFVVNSICWSSINVTALSLSLSKPKGDTQPLIQFRYVTNDSGGALRNPELPSLNYLAKAFKSILVSGSAVIS